MWRVYDPRLPWIIVRPVLPSGAIVRDTRTGQELHATSELEVAQFAAAHSATPHGVGLGDAIRGLTKRLGFGRECTPCAKRQALLNARVPRLFRR